ncbi:hypothetical protein BFJ69_g11800 [Fusarium oxysporum]|uniref:Uncharacterized protein n=1 Tax=Fusarium oxysporum TaxID=5507 RepID=A0A420MRF2_FUSOX|nr:hypothetical protein BFJ69_g11800 [Fusarium oxysporum]
MKTPKKASSTTLRAMFKRACILNTKLPKKPQDSGSYVGHHYLGFISSSDRQFLKQICQSNPPPAKQFNGSKKINPRQPLRRCQEWTAEPIAMLQSHGVLVSEGSVVNTAQPGSSRSVGRTYGQSSNQSSQARSSSSSQPVDGQTSSDGYRTFSSKYGDYYHVGKDGRTLGQARSVPDQVEAEVEKYLDIGLGLATVIPGC